MKLTWIVIGPAVFAAYVVEMFYGTFMRRPIGAFSRYTRIVWMLWAALSGLLIWRGVL